MTDYRRIDSFDRSQIGAVGIGESTLAVASGERVTLVSGTERSDFEHDESITDIAINDRIAVLSSDRVTAYTRDGARVWSRAFDSPHAVATVPDRPIAGVLQPDQIRTVNLETGQESVTVERHRPGQPHDDLFIGIESGFISATWSFLRRVDATSEEQFDKNLNTAIQAVGCCEDALIAALQNGQLKRFDIRTGEQRWETELPVQQISPRGDGVLLFTTKDGIKSVDPDGAISSVDSLPNSNVYASVDGSVVCSVRDGSVGVHAPDEDLIDAEILTNSVGVGGTIEVNVTNLSSAEHDVTLEASLEHADLSPDERRLELVPRDPTRTDFPVESVRTDGEADFTVGIDGRAVATRPVEVSDAAQSTVAAEAELNPVKVSTSAAKLDLSIENTGTIPLDSISVLETGERGADIDPGESWTQTITKPYQPGQTITVGVEITRGNRQTELAPTCRLPEQPVIELERKRDAFHGQISAEEGIIWSDELVIEAPGADRVRSPVEIENGSLLVVLPIYDEGIARIGLSNLGVSKRSKMSDQSPLADLTNSPGHSDRTPQRSGLSGGTSEQSKSTRNADQERDQGNQQERTETSRGGTQNSHRGQTGDSGGDNDETGISIGREVSDANVSVGHLVGEQLIIENRTADSVNPTVAVGGRQIEPGEIDPAGRWTAERNIVFFFADNRDGELPEATVAIEGDIVDRIPAESVKISDQDLIVRGVIDLNGSYEIEFENGATSERCITGLEIDGRPTGTNARTLQPDERTTIVGAVDVQLSRSDSAVSATAFLTGDGESSATIETLVAVRERSGDSSGGAREFEKRVGESTQVAGEYGTVVLIFENDGKGALSDVTLEATGDPVNDMLYSQAHRETLSPGERIEHYVDLKTEAGTTNFEISASYTTMGGEKRSKTFQVTGPAVETDEDWTEQHRSSWTLEAKSDGADSSFDAPERVSTEFK